MKYGRGWQKFERKTIQFKDPCNFIDASANTGTLLKILSADLVDIYLMAPLIISCFNSRVRLEGVANLPFKLMIPCVVKICVLLLLNVSFKV